MGFDPVEQWIGLERGEWAWSVAWSVVALSIAALGVVIAIGIGRIRSRITEENTKIGEWVLRGHLLLPKKRLAEARRSLSATAQWMVVLGAFDIAFRVLVQVFPSNWATMWLARAEAVAVATVVLRIFRGLISAAPAAESRFWELEGELFQRWTVRNTEVLSAKNVTGLAVAAVRLTRFAAQMLIYYWLAAFLWVSLQTDAEDIRPTLLGLIFAVVIWQAFIWFDRLFPVLEEVLDGWKGTLLRSIPFRGHAFITEQNTTDAAKGALILVRVAISASFLASFALYVLSVLPMESDWGGEIRAVQYALVMTAGAWFVFRLGAGLRQIVETRVPQWQGSLIQGWTYQNTQVFSESRLAEFGLFAAKWLSILLAGLLAYVYFTAVFALFETTSLWADSLVETLQSPVVGALLSIWYYLPNLVVLGLIFFVARSIAGAFRWFFGEIEKGQIQFTGFYPEWATPTYQLVRLAIVIFALIAAFPYLPGADTSHFKGISVFIGLVVSLGGSSAVGHAVSGVMLTYMRPFRVGDRVCVGDTTGVVMERTLLVTRIRTSKNVDVTIPNGTVLGAHIVNFSTMAEKEGLILHTSVTLGYDVPWRTIHEVMIGAARATDGILDDPPPFVLQTALDDHYVHYELNGYTREPKRMPQIYSEIHSRLQDDFAAAGIEILSPVYEAARDGSAITIPKTPALGSPEE
ncbi:MAG: mechanosensitive ion channel domain-containing protein [Myxococcota bacterium]|nr:mechanosensitive ion channel domain-containing protein [Myxococcota bacterium]